MPESNKSPWWCVGSTVPVMAWSGGVGWATGGWGTRLVAQPEVTAPEVSVLALFDVCLAPHQIAEWYGLYREGNALPGHYASWEQFVQVHASLGGAVGEVQE
jgi:hypothetical protein